MSNNTNKMDKFPGTNSHGIFAGANQANKPETLHNYVQQAISAVDKKDGEQECGEQCKMEKKDLEDEVMALRKEVQQLRMLNRGLQEDVIAKFKDFHLQHFVQANNPALHVDDVQILPPVATRKNGQVHLGRDVWIPIQIFDSISSKKASKDGLFIKDMAVAVFGELVLSKSSVTGAISNRCANKVKKPPLDPTKKMAIRDILRHRLEQRRESEENIAKILDTVNSTIAEKIQDLIRPPRKLQKMTENEDSSQHAFPRMGPDSSFPTIFLGMDSSLEPPTKLQKILPKSTAASSPMIPTTFSPITRATAAVVQDGSFTSQFFESTQGTLSLSETASRFDPSEELLIEQQPDGSLDRAEDPLSLQTDAVTVKTEEGNDQTVLGDHFFPLDKRVVLPIQDVTLKLDPGGSLSNCSTASENASTQRAQHAETSVASNVVSSVVDLGDLNAGLQKHSSDVASSSQKSSKEKLTLADFTEEDMVNPRDAIAFYRLATSAAERSDANRSVLENRIKELEQEVQCLRQRDVDSNISNDRLSPSVPPMIISIGDGSLKRKAESSDVGPLAYTSSQAERERQEIKTKQRHRDQIILLRRPLKPQPPPRS